MVFLNFISTVAAALAMVYVARHTMDSFSLNAKFTMKNLDVLREYGGQVSILDWIDDKMWSLVYISWDLLMIYQFLCYIRSSYKGLVSSIGHIPWGFNALAILGMFAHVNWLHLIQARDLFGGLVVSTLGFYFLVGALMLLLYALYKKTPELKKEKQNFDLYMMRLLVINATDFFCTYTFFNLFVILDAYLVSVHNCTPNDSNFYLMATLAFFQLANIYSDLYYFNWLTRYLAGGYITMIIGTTGIMVYQMVTLPHLSMLTLFNFVLAVLCPLIKIHVQSKPVKEIKEKEKKS